MSRGWSLRKAVGAVLFVGAASAALAAAGADALLPFKDMAGAATEVSVAFVLDFGGSTPVVVGCVKVPSSDNGYQALAVFTQQESEAAPAYNSAGLLCSIDGDPSTGCGQVVPSGYVYWSYFRGSTGSWAYASSGAFGTVQSGDVEGWRFQNPGSGRPNDPPPRATADFAGICGPVEPNPPPSTATTGVPTTAPSRAPSTSTPPTGPSAGPSPGAVTPPADTVTTVVPSPSGSAHGTGAPGGVTAATNAGSAPPVGASRGPSTMTTTATTSHPEAQSLRATPAADHQGSGASAVPLAIGGLIVIALAAGTLLGWRRRSGTP